MKLALKESLKTPNSDKTWALVFWIIQTQTLPKHVIVSKKADIVNALEQAINEEKGRQAKLDALKVTIHTSQLR